MSASQTGKHSRARAAPGKIVGGRHPDSQEGSHKTEFVTSSDLNVDSGEGNSLEVVFFKEILDHFGLPHQCEVMRVSTTLAVGEESIMEAIHEFERLQRVSNWKHAADRYEVVSATRRSNAP